MALRVRNASIAKCTCFALCDSLKITLDTSLKANIADDTDRNMALNACKDRTENGTSIAASDLLMDEVDPHKYTYFALDLGQLYFCVHGRWYRTLQRMHFTLAYLPAVRPSHKARMLQSFEGTLLEWIRLNGAYKERPYICLHLRQVRIIDDYDKNCYETRTLVNMKGEIINSLLDENRLELATLTTTQDDGDVRGRRVFEDNRKAVVEKWGRDIGRLKQAFKFERSSHGREASPHTVQMSFTTGQSEGASLIPPGKHTQHCTYGSPDSESPIKIRVRHMRASESSNNTLIWLARMFVELRRHGSHA